MTRLRAIGVSVLLIVGACGGTTSAANCTEYAAEIRAQVEDGATTEQLSRYLDDTAEQLARIVQSAPPEEGKVCADAILESLFTAGLDDFSEQLQD